MKLKIEYTYPDGKYKENYDSEVIVVDNNYSQDKIEQILKLSENLLNEVNNSTLEEWNLNNPIQLTPKGWERAEEIRECGFSIDSLLKVAEEIFELDFTLPTSNVDMTYTMED